MCLNFIKNYFWEILWQIKLKFLPGGSRLIIIAGQLRNSSTEFGCSDHMAWWARAIVRPMGLNFSCPLYIFPFSHLTFFCFFSYFILAVPISECQVILSFMSSTFPIAIGQIAQCSTPLVPWFDHQKMFDLDKFGQLYINKHITNAKFHKVQYGRQHMKKEK